MSGLLLLSTLACTSGEPGQHGSLGAQLPALAGLMPQQRPAAPSPQPEEPGRQPEEASAQPEEPGAQPEEPGAQPAQLPAMTALPALPAMPALPAPSPASDGDFCAVLCDRVAACGVATREACLPVCGPQVARLTPEERSQAIGFVEKVPCNQLTGFTNRAGEPDRRGRGENVGRGDGDDEGEQDTAEDEGGD